MDKLRKLLIGNKKLLVFLFGMFIISVVFGSILPLFLNSSDKKLITEYLSNFVSNVGNCNFSSLFFNGLFTNLGFLFIIFLLGVSIVGAVVVIFLYFLKGFVLGFSVSSIIINYGFKGVLFSFIYVFPHHIINMFMYSILTCYSLSFSIKFVMFLFKKYDFNIRFAFKRFFYVFCISSFIVLLSIFYEAFLWPRVLIFIFNLLSL